jgi:Ala-tRNA(Pro) deacylase
MEYHPVTKKITDLLSEHSAWFETFEHEPVKTSEEAANVRHGYVLHQGAKALIIRVKKGSEKNFIMVVIPGDAKFDPGKLKKVLGVKDMRFATEEEVSEITGGIQVGGVPPFGTLFGLSVYVDESVMVNEKIIFNAGDRRFSVGMKSEDYNNITNPTVVSVI